MRRAPAVNLFSERPDPTSYYHRVVVQGSPYAYYQFLNHFNARGCFCPIREKDFFSFALKEKKFFKPALKEQCVNCSRLHWYNRNRKFFKKIFLIKFGKMR